MVGIGTLWRKAPSTAAIPTALLLLALLAPGTGARPIAAGDRPAAPSLVLLTLDTTRADYLGSYGADGPATPVLDALAAGGTRYRRALTSSPLTLPAHASLMTGLDPPEHGVHDNGTEVLDPGLPTLATALSARGYATGAFVASRVLDRRFGLDRGFDAYDDRMTAEQLGEYGYPERNAAAVTTAAIAWLSGLAAAEPYFLWVHYYDPHAPYTPPREWRRAGERGGYAGEIAYMDREIGRLLAALPPRPAGHLIAVVGDHGEALGEHGERAHGIFLYRAVLEVPLFLAGPGVAAGVVVDEVVASRRLAPTLLRLLGADDDARQLGPALPGLPLLGQEIEPQPVYSETWMPANAYGWAPLQAVSDQRWRLIVAPRPELYDHVADPAESRNLIAERRTEARRLKAVLSARQAALERRQAPAAAAVDPELAADLRRLGYLAASPGGEGTIDPKDGIAMLADFERAKELMRSGAFSQARLVLENLSARNPRNVPFLTQLARAQLGSGETEEGLATYRRAVALNPQLDFLHLQLADAYRQLQRSDEARQEYERVLELNPRSASAWLALAELAHRAGGAGEERRLLLAAVEAGTASAGVRTRLGQIETAGGEEGAAEAHFRVATELAPQWAMPWLLWGELAEKRGRPDEAIERYRRAAAAAPASPAAPLRLGRVHLALGDAAAARRHLEQAAALGPRTAEGREARRLLESL